jgi:hypothetical protein
MPVTGSKEREVLMVATDGHAANDWLAERSEFELAVPVLNSLTTAHPCRDSLFEGRTTQMRPPQ